MKRTLLLVLTAIVALTMTAGNVTPEQALQKAQQFLTSRPSTNRAPGVTPQMALASRVCDLYVFNVTNGQGYVIVSNDDRTFPVLGYSESGSFDPNNIPENMKAWLQGYADEIAWLNTHNIQNISAPQTNRAGAVKVAIDPLIKTHWNQDTPFDDKTPYYGVKGGYYVYGVTPGEDWWSGYTEHCATGCVATAMAQVMYYHKWPTAATADIPSYTWRTSSGNFVLPKLSGTTFDWANMIEDYHYHYSGSTKVSDCTSAQADAVSTLMQYCGYATQMNYGMSSGTQSAKAADALKTYFDYNATTQLIVRSFYSYGDWIDILYHELSQGRPVLCGGQSAGGGHEFICDGYQTEDYFHINWGWGGMSDDYFKLSALDPDAQGIGGSSSTDGYHYGQDAIIGIQKSSDTGTVLDKVTTASAAPNLTINSITLDKASVAAGETVTATVSVTNNGANPYDGDIYLGFYKGGDNYSLEEGSDFYIPAGATKDCVIKTTPTGFTGTVGVIIWLPNNLGSYSTNGYNYTTLTVTSGGGGTPSTDNITLGRSLTVENSELTSGISYKVYGTTFNGELTITNPNASYNYYGTYQIDLYEDYDYEIPVVRIGQNITVPAGGNIKVPVIFDGMKNGSVYELDVVYVKNGSWTSFDEVGYYTAQPSIVAYAADGTQTVIKATSSYTVPAGTLAVDLKGAGVTSVTKNSEPNCIYILNNSDAVPAGLTNVVKYNAGSYTADDITLTDGNDFFSPVDFEATNVEFDYAFTVAADGSYGWNTIMLPFDVSQVTYGGDVKEWFTSSSDKDKHFWVKEFTSDDVDQVNFGYATTMTANTPYIVAFPGGKWGPDWDMSTKQIKFIGTSATVHKTGTLSTTTGGNFRFIGNTVQDNTENIYVINSTGNKFELKTTGGSAPFRAYFKPGAFDRELTSLGIGSDDGTTTGISEIEKMRDADNEAVYNLNGQRVDTPTKGLYIKNGKKYIIK